MNLKRDSFLMIFFFFNMEISYDVLIEHVQCTENFDHETQKLLLGNSQILKRLILETLKYKKKNSIKGKEKSHMYAFK